MTAVDIDHNLLFGLLALQNGLIDHDQLLDALRSWIRDKDRPIADDLVEHRYVDEEQRELVDRLVSLHLDRAGDKVERGLVSILASRWLRQSLAGVGDPDLDDSLARLGGEFTLDYFDCETDRTADSALGSPTSVGRRFRVLRPHAKGGLGAVSVALDTELNREVALKQILDRYADDLDSQRRFLLEAEVTGSLEHPGVVPVYGLGTDGAGRPYYAMRFIEGDSLKAVIERFHVDAAFDEGPGPPIARDAPVAPPLHRRLQHDRVRPLPQGAAPGHQARQRHRRPLRRDAGRRTGAWPSRWDSSSRAPTPWSRRRPPSRRERAPGRCPVMSWARLVT